MSNSYYSFGFTINAFTQARAEAVAAQFQGVEAGFSKLPSPDDLAQNRLGYLTDTGAANAIVTGFGSPATSYGLGMTLTLLVAVTNTGPATINVNSLGAKAVLRADGSPVIAGDLPAGCATTFKYDGTAFRVTGGGGIATNERILAQAAAAAAVNAPSTKANSVTSNTIASSGVKTWNIEPDKSYSIGQTLVAAYRGDGTKQMIGVITGYAGTALQLQINASSGSGTYNDWVFGIAAANGAAVGAVTGTGLASGGGNVGTDQQINVSKASAAEIAAGALDTKAITPKGIWDSLAFQPLTDAPVITPDFGVGSNFFVTVTAVRQIANPVGAKVGQGGHIEITRASAGLNTTFGNAYRFQGGTPTLGGAAGSVDIVSYVVRSVSPLVLRCALQQNSLPA